MARALYELANTHPYQTAQAEDDEEEEEEEEGEEEDEDDEEDDGARVRSNSLLAVAVLRKVVAVMLNVGTITTAEASLLLEMIQEGNEYVCGAFDLYQADQDMEELQDTLLRCAKLEARKRLADDRESQMLARMNRDHKQSKLSNDAIYKYDEIEEDEETDGSELETPEERAQRVDRERARKFEQDIKRVCEEEEDDDDEDEDDEEEEDDDEDVDEGEKTGTALDYVHLESLMNVLGVRNKWGNNVPRRFVTAVFISAHRKQLTVGQASALCDLYEAQYDLVRAAWEVFCVQGDIRDFADTLARIVRDLPFNDAGEIDYKDSASGITSYASAGAKTAAAVDAAAQSRMAEDEAKHKGMEAVKSAKRELLKHSLEMMVKQELCTADHAARLFERAVRGDVLVDAAIEAYASDKDVVEFLDTLQILANNTPEQLDAMLRSAVRMSDQETTAGMAQRPASAAGGPRPGHTSSASSVSLPSTFPSNTRTMSYSDRFPLILILFFSLSIYLS